MYSTRDVSLVATEPSTPDLKAVGHKITIAAINEYWRSRQAAEAAEESAGDPAARPVEVDAWMQVAHQAAINAESNLARCILAWSPDYPWIMTEPLALRQENRGITFEGKMYIVAHNDNDCLPMGAEHEDRTHVMYLHVIDMANVESLDEA